jgi:hypothetical protein
MIIVKQMVQQVRSYLGYPDYTTLPNHVVLLRLWDEIDAQTAQMNLPNQGWFLTHQDLQVAPGTSDYAVAATVGGSRFIPILVTTKDDSDPTHIRREIPIVPIQDVDIYYIGPSNGFTPVRDDAATITFYTDQTTGQFTARLTPQPNQSNVYDIWYQPDRPTPPNWNDNYPLLESFSNLMKVCTALTCLPELLKQDGSNAAQLQMRAAGLRDQRDRYDSVFQIQKQMSSNSQFGGRQGFATDDDLSSGWY